jgi:transposase
MPTHAPLVMEILDEAPRRRRWSEEEKLRLVAETMEPGMSVSLVARRRGVGASQLFRWRRQFAGEPGMPGQTPVFAPVRLLPAPPLHRRRHPSRSPVMTASSRSC